MSDVTITSEQLNSLAEKLDGMSADFSAEERAALQAVFALAGEGLDSLGSDVEGFLMTPPQMGASFSLNFTQPQGSSHLIGLLVPAVQHDKSRFGLRRLH